jgi:CBS domain-containing protein
MELLHESRNRCILPRQIAAIEASVGTKLGRLRNNNGLREARMTVARILAAKGRDVLTTQPHRTLTEVAAILTARNIGAAVVADAQGRILGMLSERDILRAVGKDGANVLNDAVSKHMTASVVTTREDESVDMTMEKMTTGRFRHLPVVVDERLVGIVSIGDVVKYRLEQLEHEHQAMRDYIATA